MDPRSTPPHPGGVDPRPEPVRVELDRIESRWRTLPLPQARAGMPRMRLTLDRLAEVTGRACVDDLGPAPALHQLKVLVWEACRAGRAHGIREELASLRRDLP